MRDSYVTKKIDCGNAPRGRLRMESETRKEARLAKRRNEKESQIDNTHNNENNTNNGNNNASNETYTHNNHFKGYNNTPSHVSSNQVSGSQSSGENSFHSLADDLDLGVTISSCLNFFGIPITSFIIILYKLYTFPITYYNQG